MRSAGCEQGGPEEGAAAEGETLSRHEHDPNGRAIERRLNRRYASNKRNPAFPGVRAIRFSFPGLARTFEAVLLGTLLACTPAGPAPEADAAAPPRGPLGAFDAALADMEAGRRPGPVSVLQIGDSHTANDSFSGRMRELFQARFGDGGRGLLPPGIPYRYYKPAGAHVTSDGWTVAGSYGNNPAPGPFGLAGLRQEATGPADMSVSLDSGADTAEVELLRQPGGGTVEVSADGAAPLVASTAGAGPASVPVWVTVAPPHGLHLLSVHARGDGPVAVLGWRAREHGKGVTWSNLGTPGATAGLLRRSDPGLVAAELRHEAPALVVLAFGTNEGFRNRPDLDDPADFARALALLRAGAPRTSFLVMLPPDGVRRAPGGDCPGGYATPPGLDVVRARERRDAGNAAVWDWSAAMGGRCSFVGWMEADPQLAAPDGVHLRQDGYRITAERLFAELMAGYDQSELAKR